MKHVHLKLIAVFLSVSILAGCVAAVVAGAAGMVVFDRRSLVTIEKDARLFHIIHSAIVQDPRFRDSHIVVSSFNRVVLLAGQTPTASLRVVAEKIAQSTPGVVRVYDEIAVGFPPKFSQRSRDSWITSQVRSHMLTKKGLESGSIHVVTENNVVFLMGIVTPEQARYAVEVARDIHGVTKVVKIFQYIR